MKWKVFLSWFSAGYSAGAATITAFNSEWIWFGVLSFITIINVLAGFANADWEADHE